MILSCAGLVVLAIALTTFDLAGWLSVDWVLIVAILVNANTLLILHINKNR